MKLNYPEGLHKEAIDFGEKMLKELEHHNVVQDLDVSLLNVAIIAYHTFCVSRDDVLKNGPTYKTDGFIKANPAVSIMKDQQVQLFKIFDLLGMSPKARKSMSQMVDSTEESPLKSFLIKKETRN